MTEVVSVRLPKGTVTKMKMLACRLSLERQQEVRWTSLLKQAVEALLRRQGSGGAAA